MRWAGHVANMGAKLLARRPERNILEYLSRDNIKINLKEVQCKFAEWTHLALNREQWPALVNTAMNHWAP
jgi:hypothetical protein